MQPTSTQILKINQKQNEKLKGGFNMFKTMKKRIKNEKGLTLIELLAVVVILAIIAAIAIPAIGNIVNTQRDKAVLADISSVFSAAKIANVDGSCGTDNICDKTELAPFITTKGFKGENDAVTLTGTNAPTIKYTLGSDEQIRTSKVAAKLKNNASSIASGTVIDISETNLNAAMSN